MARSLQFILASLLALSAIPLAGAETLFTATVDRNRITIDESVNLKLEVRSEGTDSVDRIDFQAPDFDTLNEYQSNYVQSFYENGVIGTRNILQLNKILRPKKVGTFEIVGIRAVSDSKTINAANISIQVDDSSVHTGPQSQNRAQGAGVGTGIRGGAKPNGDTGFFVRAEASKDKIYKGEQVIVSYYLYHKIRVNNLQVEKYPTLDGFLREDLDMPVLAQLTSERIIVGGSIYNRALLVKYAAYPLKEGTLNVDAMGVKLAYFAQNGFSGDEDDIFGSFQSLFQQMAPKMGTSRSEIIKIQVTPLPEEGRPANFTGAVGDFTISAQLDKEQVTAGEAVTVKLRVEGKGNLAGVEIPKMAWPAGIEQYESKGVARTQKTGVAEKTFDIVLIPKQQGKIDIPPIKLGFFDPQKKAYVEKQSAAMSLNVVGELPGIAPTVAAQNFEAKKDGAGNSAEEKNTRWFILGSLLGIAGVMYLGSRMLKKRQAETFEEDDTEPEILKPITRVEKTWAKLLQVSDTVRRSSDTALLIGGYEMLTGAVYDLLDREYSIGARSMPRPEMGQVLRDDKGLSDPLWNRINKLLDYSDLVRFALNSGMVTAADARIKLAEWVEEARMIELELKKREPWQNRNP